MSLYPPCKNPKALLTCLVLLSGLLIPSQAGAQMFRRLTVENGLSGNFVKTVYKDGQGFMWFGTLEGVDRFDGVEIRNFSWWFPEKNQSVNCVAEDPLGWMWLGTEKGLYRVKPDFSGVERISLGEGDIQVLSLLAKDNIVWAGTSQGLFSVGADNGSVAHYPLAGTRAGITAMAGPVDGQLWLATSQGLAGFDLVTKEAAFFKIDAAGTSQANALSSVALLGEKIYAGALSHGVHEFDVRAEQFTKLREIADDYILCLQTSDDGVLYVGTDAGGLKTLNVVTRKVTALMNDPANLSSIGSNSVYSFLKDGDGRYWVGTYSGGVSYSPSTHSVFEVVAELGSYNFVHKSIRSLYLHPSGTKFVGTRNGLYVQDARSRVTLYDKTNSAFLRGDIVLTIFPFGDDVLIGTYGGGACSYNLKAGRLEELKGHPEFLNGCVYRFDVDGDGNLWAATLNGVLRIDAATRQSVLYDASNSPLLNNLVYSLMFDAKERLWVGTMQGAQCFRVSGGALETVKADVELPKFKTVGFYPDGDGNIWISTEKGGAYVVNPDMTAINILTEKEGLSNNTVSGVIQTAKDEFWLTTYKGLTLYDRANGTYRHVGISSGLPGLVFNPNAVLRDGQGLVWLGNEKGLVVFDPKEGVHRDAVSKPRLTDVYVGGKSYLSPTAPAPKGSGALGGSLFHFKSNQRDIGFRFVSLNYHDPLDNRYAYRLLGENDQWKPLDGTNTVYFQNLSVGSYRFEVVLLDESGAVVPDNATGFDFRIHPMWYQNRWLMALLLALALALFAVIRHKLKGMKLKLKAIEEEMRHQLPEEPKEKYESSRLSEEKGQLLQDTLLAYIAQNHVYLDAELKIGDLADRLDCSVHELSQVINQNLGQSFSEFINHYRIEEVKRRLSSNEYEKFTLLAIAESCGFSSKTSFYRVFKKETGVTPAEYLGSLQRK